jgi:hypothetical protein
MPWKKLSERFPDSANEKLVGCPLVLAGPILRKVTPTSVTVWVVTKKPCKVSLWVLDGSVRISSTGSGERSTIELGRSLHMVAVTVDCAGLAPGVIYSYDMQFLPVGTNAPVSLVDATHDNLAAPLLSYFDHRRPTFCLPPADLTQLRIVHGSCRKPHGPGKLDALSLLDGLIATSKDAALQRPQQLLLTGDQIYADEVGAGLLTMITDAAVELLGHGVNAEKIPLPRSSGSPARPDKGYVPPGSLGWALVQQMSPYQRNYALGASGLTSSELKGHLISLGEYLCMYLFVWSDVLWGANDSGGMELPSVDYVLALADANRSWVPHPLRKDAFLMAELPHLSWAHFRANVPEPWRTLSLMSEGERLAVRSEIEEHHKRLADFHRTLRKVRRALANIPSYMIFDDHEVTDDWNMLLESTLRIHESPPGLGRRVIQNGLVAYALCQHWGNRPEQFMPDGDHTPAGLRLLQHLDGIDGVQYVDKAADIARQIGLPTGAEIRAGRRMHHPANSLTYNYTIEGPAHQVVVTDTRTWREWPSDSPKESILLSDEQISRQLCEGPDVPALGGRTLMVVLTTNAPPIRAIRTAEAADATANSHDHVPDVYESWAIGKRSTDVLFKRLTDRLPLVPALPGLPAVRSGHVLLLSGDVHHSFASQMYMHGLARIEDPGMQPVAAVFTQLVSSPLRNQTNETLKMHRKGHDYTKVGARGHVVSWLAIPKGRTEKFHGWNVAPAGVREVATITVPLDDTEVHVESIRVLRSGTIGGAFHDANSAGDLIAKRFAKWLGREWPMVFTETPAWTYTFFYRSVESRSGSPPQPPQPQATLPAQGSPGQRRASALLFAQSLRGYRLDAGSASEPREIVGVNNLCEITFSGAAGDRRVQNTLRWRNDAQPEQPRFATFNLPLSTVIEPNAPGHS